MMLLFSVFSFSFVPGLSFSRFSRSCLLARNAVPEALPPLATNGGRASEAAFPGKAWKRGTRGTDLELNELTRMLILLLT
jgi:hypothetical protein